MTGEIISLEEFRERQDPHHLPLVPSLVTTLGSLEPSVYPWNLHADAKTFGEEAAQIAAQAPDTSEQS